MASKIIRGARQALAFARGEITGARIHHVDIPDVQGIRADLGLTQHTVAKRFQLPPAIIRDWEHGRRVPDNAARVLLKVIAHNPKAVERAIADNWSG
ncbi:MAG: transcriptional regulator [Rhodospirillaceae bacterium]|nr:transcriptional regulator [Rhodospirillaceae bacterium]